jgi:hypothetical protein
MISSFYSPWSFPGIFLRRVSFAVESIEPNLFAERNPESPDCLDALFARLFLCSILASKPTPDVAGKLFGVAGHFEFRPLCHDYEFKVTRYPLLTLLYTLLIVVLVWLG